MRNKYVFKNIMAEDKKAVVAVVSNIQGGMSNCFKSFISALRHDPGAKTCSRQIVALLDERHVYRGEPCWKLINDWRFEIFPEDVEVTGELTLLGDKSAGWSGQPGFRSIDCGYHLIPAPVLMRINRAMDEIVWSSAFKAFWASIEGSFDFSCREKAIGVHIRSWKHSLWDKAIGVDQNCASRRFSLQDYVDELGKLDLENAQTVFVASDHPDHIASLQAAFPGVAFCFVRGGEGAGGAFDALADCLLLSKCGTIIGKHDSTFTELAWYFGKQRAKMILV
jgi:hypothetical protein